MLVGIGNFTWSSLIEMFLADYLDRDIVMKLPLCKALFSKQTNMQESSWKSQKV